MVKRLRNLFSKEATTELDKIVKNNNFNTLNSLKAFNRLRNCYSWKLLNSCKKSISLWHTCPGISCFALSDLLAGRGAGREPGCEPRSLASLPAETHLIAAVISVVSRQGGPMSCLAWSCAATWSNQQASQEFKQEHETAREGLIKSAYISV